jgi:hypothetical protein
VGQEGMLVFLGRHYADRVRHSNKIGRPNVGTRAAYISFLQAERTSPINDPIDHDFMSPLLSAYSAAGAPSFPNLKGSNSFG